MSDDPASLAQRLVEADAAAWADRKDRAAYDLAVSRLIEGLDESADRPDQLEALPALAEAWLGRPGSGAPDTAALLAERLLAVVHGERAPVVARAEALFLRAWESLGDTANRGPRSISVAAPLPEGLVLPEGADASAVPGYEAAARHQADDHARAATLWNDRQAALRHLERLAALIRDPAASRGSRDRTSLMAAMARTPGVPPALAASLAQGADPGSG
jgi:hypothetical protein